MLPYSFSLEVVYANGDDDAGNRIFWADYGFPYFNFTISYLTFVDSEDTLIMNEKREPLSIAEFSVNGGN